MFLPVGKQTEDRPPSVFGNVREGGGAHGRVAKKRLDHCPFFKSLAADKVQQMGMAVRVPHDRCKNIGVKFLDGFDGQAPDLRVAAVTQKKKGRDQVSSGKREIPPGGLQLRLAGGSFADDPGDLR
jgi:hypothetical protein